MNTDWEQLKLQRNTADESELEQDLQSAILRCCAERTVGVQYIREIECMGAEISCAYPPGFHKFQ